MRLPNLNLDARVFGSPSPQESPDLGELLHVPSYRTMLADVEAAIALNQSAGQPRVPMQKEPIADEHQF
jgi:hypothetical protein